MSSKVEQLSWPVENVTEIQKITPAIIHTILNPANPVPLNGPSYILCGNALEILKLLPANSFRCCVTSPPYWGLRDYGTPGQIGVENDLDEYINALVAILHEVKRVLADDVTLWLNLGDAYTSGGRAYRAPDKKTDNGHVVRGLPFRPPTPAGLKPKDLIGIPWRVAFRLQEDGWYLRSDIIWYKPNAIPESVKDSPTLAHEYLFLLSKSERYYYDYYAIREATENGRGHRNKRTVWAINTQAFPEAHFATFPEKLVEPCIKAGSAPGDYILDPFFGSGTSGLVAASLQRNFVGIDINPRYVTMAQKRIEANLP